MSSFQRYFAGMGVRADRITEGRRWGARGAGRKWERMGSDSESRGLSQSAQIVFVRKPQRFPELLPNDLDSTLVKGSSRF